jgi:hypothetical protein
MSAYPGKISAFSPWISKLGGMIGTPPARLLPGMKSAREEGVTGYPSA